MRVHGIRNGSVLELERRLGTAGPDLRWGGPQVASAINGNVHLLDGLEQLQALEAAKVPVPEYTVDPVEALDVSAGTIVLARNSDHTQGQDIIIAGQRNPGRRSWRKSDYFVKYIPDVVREWRFHILRGSSIARGLKHFVEGSELNGAKQPAGLVIRSRRLGWHMRHDVTPGKPLRETAKKAVDAIGYELGAVDLLELNDGSAIVLEVNSRPAIRDEYTLEKYCNALRGM